MTSPVAVVTDSTASPPAAVVARHDITVVPLQVVIGFMSYDEGTDVTAQTLSAALGEQTPVSTSRPTPQVFLQAYESAASAGAESAVSVHLSGEVSGTYESAQLAAQEASIPVEVVDSRQVGMGTGFAVLAAARVVEAGGAAVDAAAAARACARATTVLFCVDTLEHLRRGGRIGAAAALVGSVLVGQAAAQGGQRAHHPAGEGPHLVAGAQSNGGSRRAGGRGSPGRRGRPSRRQSRFRRDPGRAVARPDSDIG